MRDDLILSQKQLARRLDITEVWFSKLKNRKAPITEEMAEKIHSVTGISRDTIINGSRPTIRNAINGFLASQKNAKVRNFLNGKSHS